MSALLYYSQAEWNFMGYDDGKIKMKQILLIYYTIRSNIVDDFLRGLESDAEKYINK